VSRLFSNSAYIVAGDEMILLLRGELRSPINVNLSAPETLSNLMSAEESCSLAGGEMRFDRITVRIKGARVYRSGLGKASASSPVAGKSLAKGVGILRLLYEASQPGFDLFMGDSFRRFADTVLAPLSRGEPDEAYKFRSYLQLIGLGSGFTPAGDDFVGGFTGALNHVSRKSGGREILFSDRELMGRTVPESAALIRYAQMGYVDEEFERLVISTFGGRRGHLFRDLLQVAKRGHTSGIDMSMGVLIAAAAIRDRASGEKNLERCLRKLES
jgi:Protein of unknown function (DUF2877)